jgi:hypothetical protein
MKKMITYFEDEKIIKLMDETAKKEGLSRSALLRYMIRSYLRIKGVSL